MKLKSKKSALLMSFTSLLLCFAMLAGSTFAWFTDTATTGVNKIVSGKLKVDIVAEDGVTSLTGEDKELKFQNNANSNDILWEPGVTFLTQGFKIKNDGNLALKWKMTVNKENVANGKVGSVETPSKSLLDVIDFSVVTAPAKDADAVAIEDFVGHLLKETASTETYYIKAHMQETAGNDYQSLTLDGITITVYATQDTVENDSFDNQYDKFAEYPEVSTVQIEAGDEETVNNAVKNAIVAAKTVNATTGKTTPTQIVLPANTTVSLESGVAAPAQGQTSDIKITGDKTTKLSFQNANPGSEGALCYQDGANLTFQGITIDTSAIKGICARGGVVTFVDCTFDSELKKTIATKFVFSGCTFTEPVSQVGYGCKDVVFDNCKFNTDGYGIKIYSEGSTPVNLTVKNCEFKNVGGAAKSAIFLDHIIDGISYSITVDGCSFEGFTATPTANENTWATRMIVTDSFVKTADEYIFSYQTGAEGGNHHKILTTEQLSVTVK